MCHHRVVLTRLAVTLEVKLHVLALRDTLVVHQVAVLNVLRIKTVLNHWHVLTRSVKTLALAHVDKILAVQ